MTTMGEKERKQQRIESFYAENLEQFYQFSAASSHDYDPSPANIIVCSSVFLNSLLLFRKHIAVAPCRPK